MNSSFIYFEFRRLLAIHHELLLKLEPCDDLQPAAGTGIERLKMRESS